jgi:predicted signal transduction protein with EAL and GGDEF domain
LSLTPPLRQTPVELQKYADIAMYRAKATGQNRLKFFAAEMGSITEASLGLEQILRHLGHLWLRL